MRHMPLRLWPLRGVQMKALLKMCEEPLTICCNVSNAKPQSWTYVLYSDHLQVIVRDNYDPTTVWCRVGCSSWILRH